MKGWSLPLKKAHVIRIDPSEDVLCSISDYCKRYDIDSAVVANGYGTLARWSLHWVTHNRIPTVNSFDQREGGIEILSMSGMIVEMKTHIHIALATQKGGFGGHMEEGCMAYVVCEVTLLELNAPTLHHEKAAVNIDGMGSGMINRLEK